MTNSAFIPSQFVVQLPNNFQPPQWGAPALLGGVHVVVGADGTPLYQPAYTARPASLGDLTPEILEAINNQLGAIGLRLSKVDAE